MTVRETLRKAAKAVSERDAELILACLLEQPKVWLIAHSDDQVSRNIAVSLEQLLKRRASGEPLQYILGNQEFFGLSLWVGPGVLIPRPETEHLVEAVLDWAASLNGPLRIADVGTGSGAIALALARQLPQAEIVATDISINALRVAEHNASRLRLSERVSFQQSDLLSAPNLRGLDAIASNPPYVPVGDAVTMQREVVEHEPHDALFAGLDGLDIYRRLIPQAQSALRPGGLLAMEFGFGQKAELAKLLAGWRNVRFINDYAGIPRVVLANRV